MRYTRQIAERLGYDNPVEITQTIMETFGLLKIRGDNDPTHDTEFPFYIANEKGRYAIIDYLLITLKENFRAVLPDRDDEAATSFYVRDSEKPTVIAGLALHVIRALHAYVGELLPELTDEDRVKGHDMGQLFELLEAAYWKQLSELQRTPQKNREVETVRINRRLWFNAVAEWAKADPSMYDEYVEDFELPMDVGTIFAARRVPYSEIEDYDELPDEWIRNLLD